METLVLQKDKLKDFLKALGDVCLLAPVTDTGKTQFCEVSDIDEVELDLNDYTATTKKVMFPQTETMFAFRSTPDGVDVEDSGPAQKTVVFGIRPCDARSFVTLDPLFTKDFDDPYYMKRREATVLIGHACVEPTNRCFCPSVSGSPSGTEGLDVLLTDIEDSYHVQVVTDKGKQALSGAKSLLTPAGDAEKKKKQAADKASSEKIRRSVDLKKMHDLLPKAFGLPEWKEMGNKCIGCGICTYNCPTCHCFDIQDEGTPYQGRRLRTWDACMFSEFTVHASGENPRHDRSARLRNRMMHKFSYYPRNLGFISCVGCGRCIELCPVNEDLIQILNTVREVCNE
jgi:sulfhydrogenase subunit beta (sulfur reductase)